MAINFAAASTAGLNNPGTEIITLVKDGSGNFINPPSYDKMREYLRSGEVPMLFVTDEGGETGSFYQFSGYSGTENKIRFSNDTNAIEFCAGCEVPNVVEISSGGGSADFVVNGTINSDNTVTLDKTFAQIQAAIQSAYEMGNADKVRQEINSLKRLTDSFRRIVITGPLQPTMVDENGIMFVNIFDFLDQPARYLE